MTRNFLLGGALLATLSLASPAQATTYAVGHTIFTDAVTGPGSLANFIANAFAVGRYDYLLAPLTTSSPTLDKVSAANSIVAGFFSFFYGQPGNLSTSITFAETATTAHTATYHLQQFAFGAGPVTTQLAVSADRTVATPGPLSGAGLISALAGLWFWRRRRAEV